MATLGKARCPISSIPVIAAGETVLIGSGINEPIHGTISAVCIRGVEVTYEVSWWDGRRRETAWISDRDLRPLKHDYVFQRIGFASRVGEATP
jgi:hypothetical protein